MKIDISIIIIVWNKYFEMNLILKALTLQNFPKEIFEVIIVDDGSKIKLTNIINKYNKIINIKYIRKNHSGNRAKNRNTGIKASSGKKIIFIDGDMIPDRNMINSFNNEIKNDRKNICLGIRYKLPPMKKYQIDENVIENNFNFLKKLPGINDERIKSLIYCKKNEISEKNWIWHMFYSHSIALWKNELKRVGGFNKIFSKKWGAEDIELGYRFHKNGYNIKINQNIIFYHIFHDENILDKEEQLIDNYKLFLKKDNTWEVELFINEKELNVKTKTFIINKIKNMDFLISDINDADKLLNAIPKETILFGIDNEKLIKSKKVSKILIPESLKKSNKIKNLIGIQTLYKDKHFNCAVISENYKKINEGLFHLILTEAKRISKKIIIISNQKIRKNLNFIKNSILINNYVIFQLSGYNNNLLKYMFFNLAISCENIGLNTGIYFPSYADDNINLNFLEFKNNLKKSKINNLINKNLDICGFKIPNIIDPYLSEYNVYPKNFRFLWDDPVCLNHYNIYKPFLNTNKHILLTNSNENFLNNKSLKIGIDCNKINQIKKSKINKSDIFTFLTIERYTTSFSNLETAIICFLKLFKNNMNVEFKIIVSNKLDIFNSSFFSKSYKDILNKKLYSNELMLNNNLYKLKKKYEKEKNIIFIDNIVFDEDYTLELFHSNAYININSTSYTDPFVLESIAFGKKPILNNYKRYKDYFEKSFCFEIKSNENIINYTEDFFYTGIHNKFDNFILNNEISTDSLINILKNIYKNKKIIKIPENTVFNFINNNSWNERAMQLKNILKQYF